MKNVSQQKSDSAWVYQTAAELATHSIQAKQRTYSGGGYVLLLTTKTHHKKMLVLLQRLQDRRWIDDDTRVIFIEFTVFNPTTNLFVIVTLAFEFVSLGTVEPYRNIATVQLYSLTEVNSGYVIVCEVIYFMFMMWYTVSAAKSLWHMRQRTREYFSSMWTYVDWSIVFFTHLAVLVHIMRVIVVRKTIAQAKQSNAEKFVSFYPAVAWEFLLIYVFGVILTLLMLNVLRLSSYVSKRHAIFASAMSGSGLSIAGVICLYVATFIVTLAMSVLQFSDSCGGYSTGTQAVIRMIRLYMYDMDGNGNRCVDDKPLSNLFFFGGVMFCIAMLWRPLLIICGLVFLFSSGRKQNMQLQEDMDFIDFLWNRFLVFIGYWEMSDYASHVDHEQARRVSLHAPHLEWVALEGTTK